MESTNGIKENSQAVQSHLSIIQNVIQRTSTNSASCKAWCITLVSAILVIVADKSKPDFALIALIPTILFFVLDAYYLALEKGFRNSYNNFINKLHTNSVLLPDLFVVEPEGKMFILFLKAIKSFSIYPFYLSLVLIIFFAKQYILPIA